MKVNGFKFEFKKEKRVFSVLVVLTDASSDGGGWIPFQKGEVIVFSCGEKVFSTHSEYSKQKNIKLSDNEIKVLKFIRTSPQRVSFSSIISNTNFSKEETVQILRNLFKCRLVERDTRYKDWEDNNSLYYTHSSMRKTVDELL